jgi:hypothetical protein
VAQEQRIPSLLTFDTKVLEQGPQGAQVPNLWQPGQLQGLTGKQAGGQRRERRVLRSDCLDPAGQTVGADDAKTIHSCSLR